MPRKYLLRAAGFMFLLCLLIIGSTFDYSDAQERQSHPIHKPVHIKAYKVKIKYNTGFQSRCIYVELTDWCYDIQAIKAQLGIDDLTLAY